MICFGKNEREDDSLGLAFRMSNSEDKHSSYDIHSSAGVYAST